MVSGRQVRVKFYYRGKWRTASENQGNHKLEIGDRVYVKINPENEYTRIMHEYIACDSLETGQQPTEGWKEIPCLK